MQAECPIRGRPGLAHNAWQFGYLPRAVTRLALRAAPRIWTGMTILYGRLLERCRRRACDLVRGLGDPDATLCLCADQSRNRIGGLELTPGTVPPPHEIPESGRTCLAKDPDDRWQSRGIMALHGEGPTASVRRRSD